VFERLGIADEMKKKSRLTPIGGGFPLVARSEVTLGIAQTADFAPPIGPPLGVELIGPLPESVQERILLSAAVASSARQPQAARALVIFLASPAASPAIAAHGMER
jgi:molybdate transport system substrate-binding protein